LREIGRELKRRNENRTMKRFLVWVILLSMPLRSSLAAQPPRQAAVSEIARHPQTQTALGWFEPHLSSINEMQIKLAETPAPSYQEEQRAAAVAELLGAAGLTVHRDKIGNVIGELRGANEKEVVIMSAHLDTVFPAGTDVKVRHEGERLSGPGISDNGTGLAGLVAIARAMQAAKIKPRRTIVFAADVGEEGEGNLRGMRALVDAYRTNLKAAIVISGPGGHSWSDFGMVNPINALVRGAVRFINTRVPTAPRTTFNLGQIEGGTSVNSIPHEAKLKVDIRSESEEELGRLETALRECVAAGVRDEMESARDRSKGRLEWKVELLGSRPGGELAAGSAVLVALRAADGIVGNHSRLERSSTDANIPLSMGIDAIAIGAGGNGGGAHSLQEWYDPVGRELGLKRALLTLLEVAGIASEKTQ
jgi:tripeptide aminopeptidase